MPKAKSKSSLSSSYLEHLYRAIADDNADKVSEYLEQNDLNELEKEFYKHHNASIVQKVCQNNSYNSLEKVLRHRHYNQSMSLIEFRDFENKTALHHCALFNAVECANILLQNNANVCALKRGDTTPLMIAAHKDNLEMFILLMKYNSKYNVQDANGWNCGHIASRNGSRAILEWLYRECSQCRQDKAFWNCKTKNGSTMLHIAAHNGHTNVVELLMNDNETFSNENQFEHDCEGKRPHVRAIVCDNVQIFVMLYDEKRMNINDRDACGRTSLHLCSAVNALSICRFIVEKLNADLDCLDNWNQTPLFIAVRNNHRPVFEYLVRAGASLECIDRNGNSVRTLCQQFNRTEMLHFLEYGQKWVRRSPACHASI